MATTIANPIYDLAFKYLMEDECVVKILLSDLLRFRQYLGTQYRTEENMVPDIGRESVVGGYSGVEGDLQSPEGKGKRKHALPMVAIYLLGHPVGSIEEPVLYVNPRAENYDREPVTQGLPDPFVDSLTHYSIIVQIPLLHGRLRNHVERILNIFDQERRDSAHSHLLNIDEADYSGDEDQRLIFHRLLTAGASREMRERMEMEAIMLRDYDERGMELLRQKKLLKEKDEQLQEQSTQLQEQSEQLKQKDSQLLQQNVILCKSVLALRAAMSTEQVAAKLDLSVAEVEAIGKD